MEPFGRPGNRPLSLPFSERPLLLRLLYCCCCYRLALDAMKGKFAPSTEGGESRRHSGLPRGKMKLLKEQIETQVRFPEKKEKSSIKESFRIKWSLTLNVRFYLILLLLNVRLFETTFLETGLRACWFHTWWDNSSCPTVTQARNHCAWLALWELTSELGRRRGGKSQRTFYCSRFNDSKESVTVEVCSSPGKYTIPTYYMC